MHFDEHYDGKEISVSLNDEFEIALSEIRTAGYRWIIIENGEPAVRLLEEVSKPNSAGVGGSGLHVWRFLAVSAGAANVRFQYSRPWEDPANPARTFNLKVRVGS
jgi:predicted secreted protein